MESGWWLCEFFDGLKIQNQHLIFVERATGTSFVGQQTENLNEEGTAAGTRGEENMYEVRRGADR